MAQQEKGKKIVLVKGYTTDDGRVVPDHYRTTPNTSDQPKGSFIERRERAKDRRRKTPAL